MSLYCQMPVMPQLPLKHNLAVGSVIAEQYFVVEFENRLCLKRSSNCRLRIATGLIVVKIFLEILSCVVSFDRISLLISL